MLFYSSSREQTSLCRFWFPGINPLKGRDTARQGEVEAIQKLQETMVSKLGLNRDRVRLSVRVSFTLTNASF
jgi:hypothetical protein